MDLTTIEDKLIKNRYKTTEDFVADFSLIIKNCVQYNGKGNGLYLTLFFVIL